MYNINNFVVLLSWARMGLTPIDKSPPTHSMIISFNMLSIMSGIHKTTKYNTCYFNPVDFVWRGRIFIIQHDTFYDIFYPQDYLELIILHFV
jgi:hypothetical protein